MGDPALRVQLRLALGTPPPQPDPRLGSPRGRGGHSLPQGAERFSQVPDRAKVCFLISIPCPLLRNVIAAALHLQPGCVCVCVSVLGEGVLGLPRGRRGDCGGRPGSCGEYEGLSDRRGFSLLLGRGRGFAEPGRSARELEKPGRDGDSARLQEELQRRGDQEGDR